MRTTGVRATMTRATAAAGVLLTLALAGCGSGDEPRGAPDAASPPAPSTSTSTSTSPLPATPLLDAQYAFRAGGWWRWEASVRRADGSPLRVETGFVDASDAQHPQAYLSGGGLSSAPEQLSAVYDGTDAWFHRGELTEEVAGCWVHRSYPARDVAGGSSVYLLPPVARVLVVGDLRQARPGVLEAVSDLDAVAESMGSLVRFGLHLPGPRGQVPVTYTVAEDGTFTGWRAELDDLVASVRELGLEPEPTLLELHATIEVAVEPAAPQQVAAPPADQLVEWDEAHEPIQVAFGRCGRS